MHGIEHGTYLLHRQHLGQPLGSAHLPTMRFQRVYLEVHGDTGKLRMVATDGHRLALVDREIPGDLRGIANGVIIPRKGLTELKRLLDEPDAGEIEIGFEGSSGLARRGDVTLVMRLIEGEFPNYRQVIPAEVAVQLVVPTDPFVQALRRVALLSSERSRSRSSGLIAPSSAQAA